MFGLCNPSWLSTTRNQKTPGQADQEARSPPLIISATLFAAGAVVGVFDGTGYAGSNGKCDHGDHSGSSRKVRSHHLWYSCASAWSLRWNRRILLWHHAVSYAGRRDLWRGFPEYALTMLIGKNLALMVSPLVPATYLAIGLTGTELKDHMKFQHSAVLHYQPYHAGIPV